MILKRDIMALLQNIESLYNEFYDPIISSYFSKLSIIEICGWIEESFDKIALRAIKGKIRTTAYNNILEDRIKNNYGFDYKKNFRKMMIQIVGIVEMERLEIELTRTGEINTLISTLKTLKIERDNAAHTTIAGAMPLYQSPILILSHLNDLYPIFKKIYSFVIQINRKY